MEGNAGAELTLHAMSQRKDGLGAIWALQVFLQEKATLFEV
ncbi:hypothetical protein PPTG_22611 [Phytophthora nicotianae INRA-310]|uniref:Uncharacterized protein n=2 Tax=Phytophthora nicotianae TaxID=4792 RepID=W2QCN4_PHYN3|nr:hypothetical protein PPTG_22611 [Phytophthora nicotianae INRA-310]ETN10943.1 hypothetical protein PPTG_22611 [Phytophthora nicotianae INRA-310]ETO77907.1 hypothetical protein F444_06972 [Phytophthora nicotianae P1976]